MTKRMIQILAAGILGALASGCQNNNKPKTVHGEDFPEAGQTTQVQRFVRAQVQNGARTNATLYPYHFDGANLNSAGEAKLLAMIDDDNSESPLIIYIDVPADDVLAAKRQQAADGYLKEAGLHAEQYKFVFGTNPNQKTFAAPEIVNYPKADSAEEASGAGGAGGSSSSGSSTSGGGAH